MAENWDDIEALRERMREAVARDFAAGTLGADDFETALDKINLVLSEADVGRLGLARFALGGEADAVSPTGIRADSTHLQPGIAHVPPAPAAAYPALPASFTFIGSARHVLMPDDRGVSSTILIGDIRVDCTACRSASIDLDLMCLLGDVIVEVSADRLVVNEMGKLLGEFKDKSMDPSIIDPAKVLRLRGFQVLGDVKILRR
jgi:hypothetical protein